MKIKVALGAVVMALLLTGCGASHEGGTGGTYEYVDVPTGNGGSVPCVIWDGYQAGGISCNWGN